ncbi:4285_t:CDS:1, partial [Racocetra persica]
PGNVNFCGIEVDEGYEPEVEEEEAFVTPVARHQPYSTQRPREQRSKRLEDQATERYRFILPRPEAPVVPPVNVNPPQPVPKVPVAPLARPRRKRGPSVIDQLESYDIAEDIMSLMANVTVGQMLQYSDQRQKLTKALRRPLPPLEPSVAPPKTMQINAA